MLAPSPQDFNLTFCALLLLLLLLLLFVVHMQAIASREVPIPDHLDMYHLHQEAEPSDRTALEAVVDHIREEMERLHAQVGVAVGIT
jgi:Na+-transporting methylmalonyl-CoA/oxaloacetate decarboxylase gamma subunit